VREAPCPEFEENTINSVAESFIGEYDLRPPVYSALKKGGRRLYEMARAGERPEVESRRVKIYSFDIFSIDIPVITCLVRCSRGTYVRSIARDVGEKLGLPAHIANIVRTRIGPFENKSGFPSDKLFDGDLEGLRGYDLEHALDFLPAVVLEAKACRALLYGMLPVTRDVVKSTGEYKHGGPVRLLDESGALLAMGLRNPGKRRNPLQLVDSYRLFLDTSPGKGKRTAC
jgi:tRNA pseudouridine55 synthase